MSQSLDTTEARIKLAVEYVQKDLLDWTDDSNYLAEQYVSKLSEPDLDEVIRRSNGHDVYRYIVSLWYSIMY